MNNRPTPQQEAIFAAIAGGQQNLTVEALAGTGKTTTAVGCLSQQVPGKIGMVAFNRHIAAELQDRLPATVRACTLHSLGFSAVRSRFRDTTVDEQKLQRMARQLKPDFYPSERQAAEQLCRLSKYTLCLENGTEPAEAFDGLADHFGVELPRNAEAVFDLAQTLYERSAQDVRNVDFDDMVWLPIKLDLSPESFDLLLVDEAQDLNRCQQQLALAAVNGGRLVPVGDRHQAIYGFSGSDCDALPRLAERLAGSYRGGHSLPLTVTWRCPTSHVALAQQIVPEIEAAPNAVEGTIQTASLKEIGRACEPGDLIVCRKNAPLVGLTYKLVLAGVRATMRGRDIGKGLLNLVARLRPDSLEDLIRRLAQHEEREQSRLVQRDAPASAFQALEDRCECLSQLASQVDSLEALERFIAQTFDDQAKPGAAVVLSSVHRAKGLEADRVFVLDPDSLPLIHRDSKPWERQQELNICYIAVTRAKKELTFEDHYPKVFKP